MARFILMIRNIKISLNQLAAATDRICSLQEEQQQLREQNELIRERSEKRVEVRSWPLSWAACSSHRRVPRRSQAQNVQRCPVWQQKVLPAAVPLSGHLTSCGFPSTPSLASRPLRVNISESFCSFFGSSLVPCGAVPLAHQSAWDLLLCSHSLLHFLPL